VVWAFTTFYASNWRPITWLSHMADCQVFGLNPGAHHLVNIALQLVNALLLFTVLRLGASVAWRSFMVAPAVCRAPIKRGNSGGDGGTKEFTPCPVFVLDGCCLRMVRSTFRLEKIPRCCCWFCAGTDVEADGGDHTSHPAASGPLAFESPCRRFLQAEVGEVGDGESPAFSDERGERLRHHDRTTFHGRCGAFQRIVARVRLENVLQSYAAFVPVIGIVQVGYQAMADRYAYIPFIGLFIMLTWGFADIAENNSVSPTVLVVASFGLAIDPHDPTALRLRREYLRLKQVGSR
jgi:hypothetical protein